MNSTLATPNEKSVRLHSPFHAIERWRNDFRKIMSDRVLESRLGFRKTWYLGALTLGTFTIQVGTGLLLMLYYHPSIPQGYADMKDLEFVVSSGTLLRALHRWSAHAMVFLVFVHMAKVFYRAAYRPPRELNWVLGVCLLILTLLLSYTGYLLPWDQLSYWGTTVGSNIISSVPWLGPQLRFYMLGGHTVNANALLRFYVLHTMILPLGVIALLSVHLWRLHKDGGMFELDEDGLPVVHGSNEQANAQQAMRLANEKTVSYSELLFREITAIEALAVVLFIIALTWAAPLEQLANPMHTPNVAKAPWYFTGLQELLHFFPPFVAGIILPGIIVSGLIFVPFTPVFDNIETRQAVAWFREKGHRWAVVAVIVLAITGALIRVHAWDAMLPLWIAIGLILFSTPGANSPGIGFRGWLAERPVSFWIMTLFLMEVLVLTAVGTFFRGPGWAWVWPWGA